MAVSFLFTEETETCRLANDVLHRSLYSDTCENISTNTLIRCTKTLKTIKVLLQKDCLYTLLRLIEPLIEAIRAHPLSLIELVLDYARL